MESKLKIKSVQTVMPTKPTNPRQSLRISNPENVGSSIYKTSLNLVFCYKKSSEEESGSLVAGWIRESLGMALSHKPILAGRLRQKEGSDEGEMEIVSNDSGIRLIEAQIDVPLQEFLDLKNKDDDEGCLLFWKDIDHENPQYSPLVYIQVTSFSSGGYSIGISCSLILMDPFSMINFLKTWTNIHLHLISNTTNLPLFYRSNHNNTIPSLNQSIGEASERAGNTPTTIFSIDNKNNKNHKNLAELCIYEAERTIGIKPISSRTVLYVKESTDDIKITRFDNKVYGDENEKPFTSKNEFSLGKFEDLEGDEITFTTDCKPAYSKWWIGGDDGDEAVVMVLPSFEMDGSGLKFIATLPVEK